MGAISTFLETQFKHFNARESLDAARGWCELLDDGGEMLLAMAGAMSSAELGISLAEMIRQGKLHAISCTAANLEEDLFNLFANREYEKIPHYRDLSPEDELALRNKGFNRVTDTCIPESVMRHTEEVLVELWKSADANGTSQFLWEYVYELLDCQELVKHYQAPPEQSWVLAAKEQGIPIWTPGWEDSTLGNIFTARIMLGHIEHHSVVRTGTEQMEELAKWYLARVDQSTPVGFFQIGGGIAGDFPICVVPMLIQDYKRAVPFWAYFAQISDSTTSYGSYSGAVPNEKITWYKLDTATPKYMINSDATIVAPLIFAYVLGE
jgi:deoxyhypusine synthase